MIAILLAPAGVAAGRLQMSVGVLAEPGIGISGGKANGVQPIDFAAIRDPLSLFVEIGPVPPLPLARVAGLLIATVAQSLALFVHRFAS